MINIYEYKDIQEVTIEYDLYSPINIIFNECSNIEETTIYWRTGDFNKSLIEVEIGKYTNCIHSITLVLCDNVCRKKYEFKNINNVVLGCPIVTLNESNENLYLDERGLLKLYIDDNDICIMFSKNEIANGIRNENVIFLLDSSKQWIGLIIMEVNSENINVLLQSLK